MNLAPHPRSMTADLLRLLAAWLAVIVLVQGFAAARALGLGPLHRHDMAAASAALPHQHAEGERHHHAPAEAGLALEADDPDFGAFALTAALTLLAFAAARRFVERRRHVWRAAPSWAWLTACASPPLQPPRTRRA